MHKISCLVLSMTVMYVLIPIIARNDNLAVSIIAGIPYVVEKM